MRNNMFLNFSAMFPKMQIIECRLVESNASETAIVLQCQPYYAYDLRLFLRLYLMQVSTFCNAVNQAYSITLFTYLNAERIKKFTYVIFMALTFIMCLHMVHD